MTDVHRMNRRMEMMFGPDWCKCLDHDPPPRQVTVRPEDCEVVGTIVYDHEMRQIRYESGDFPKKEEPDG